MSAGFASINRARRVLMVLVIALSAVAGVAMAGPHYGDVLVLPERTNLADPTVIRVGETTYLYPTSTGVSIECWSSTDQVEWTYEGVVWGPAPAGAWNDQKVWAPDVLFRDGLYYLYYTAGNCIGVAVADSPTGPFVDVYDHPFIGLGYGATLFFSIDAHVFEDDDGQLYMYCTCYWPVSCIRVAPMPDPLSVDGPWSVAVVPKLFSWEGVVAEGPWVIKREGTIYLMYSGNRANTLGYAIGYATADHPLGPFTKHPGNPILATDTEAQFFGPGHNGVVAGPQGGLRMVYHTKQHAFTNWTRQLRSDALRFDPHGNLYVDLGHGGQGSPIEIQHEPGKKSGLGR